MDTKEREWFNKRVTTEMNKIVEELEDRNAEPSPPEPQAGDVWETSWGGYVFIYRHPIGGELIYIYGDGSGGLESLGRKLKGATRIFSLQEYLKDKDKLEEIITK